jgi:hypothetical protein
MECGSATKARMVMRGPHLTQTSGSIWCTLAISLAQLGEQRRRGGSALPPLAPGSGESVAPLTRFECSP